MTEELLMVRHVIGIAAKLFLNEFFSQDNGGTD